MGECIDPISCHVSGALNFYSPLWEKSMSLALLNWGLGGVPALLQLLSPSADSNSIPSQFLIFVYQVLDSTNSKIFIFLSGAWLWQEHLLEMNDILFGLYSYPICKSNSGWLTKIRVLKTKQNKYPEEKNSNNIQGRTLLILFNMHWTFNISRQADPTLWPISLKTGLQGLLECH